MNAQTLNDNIYLLNNNAKTLNNNATTLNNATLDMPYHGGTLSGPVDLLTLTFSFMNNDNKVCR